MICTCSAFHLLTSKYRSEAKDLLGDDWVQIHRRIVQQHANQYKRVSWAKVCFLGKGLFLTVAGFTSLTRLILHQNLFIFLDKDAGDIT